MRRDVKAASGDTLLIVLLCIGGIISFGLAVFVWMKRGNTRRSGMTSGQTSSTPGQTSFSPRMRDLRAPSPVSSPRQQNLAQKIGERNLPLPGNLGKHERNPESTAYSPISTASNPHGENTRDVSRRNVSSVLYGQIVDAVEAGNAMFSNEFSPRMQDDGVKQRKLPDDIRVPVREERHFSIATDDEVLSEDV